MTVKLQTEHHLEFLGLKGGYKGSSESTLAKMPHCWKSHVVAHLLIAYYLGQDMRIPLSSGLENNKSSDQLAHQHSLN